MFSDWTTWCRLCANQNATFEMDTLDELNEITMRHFKLSLQHFDDVCSSICEECYNFINKLDEFEERCLQTSLLLAKLCTTRTDGIELLESQIQDLRLRFLNETYNESDTDQFMDEGQSEYGNTDDFSEELLISDVDHNATADWTNFNEVEHNPVVTGIQVIPEDMNVTTSVPEKLHEVAHFPNEQGMVHCCEYCEKEFADILIVLAHIKEVHTGVQPYLCVECKRTFSTKDELKKHQLTEQYKCPQCPKKFSSISRLKVHEDVHNGTSYTCLVCGMTLNTKRTLRMHMVVHSDFKKYKCDYCGNKYKRRNGLKMHLVTHTGEKRYKCPFCDTTFAYESQCRVHKSQAHPMEYALLRASKR